MSHSFKKRIFLEQICSFTIGLLGVIKDHSRSFQVRSFQIKIWFLPFDISIELDLISLMSVVCIKNSEMVNSEKSDLSFLFSVPSSFVNGSFLLTFWTHVALEYLKRATVNKLELNFDLGIHACWKWLYLRNYLH